MKEIGISEFKAKCIDELPGKAVQSSVWSILRIRWLSCVDVANFVPAKTAIFGALSGWRDTSTVISRSRS